MWLSIAIFFVAFFLPSVIQADGPIYTNDASYDSAAYGAYPVQSYSSTDRVSPRLNILQSSPECNNMLLTFLSPRGGGVSEPTATILDQEGHLVWSLGGYEQIYNFMVQKYMGDQCLTFWAGNDAVGGHGAGYYYIFDASYREIMKVPAAGGLQGDLHEFRITENGTAIITVYEVITADLTELGKSPQGELWDCLVQEFVIETGKLVFQWRASEHYSVSDTFNEIGDNGGIGRPFDFFHINSVEKDPTGNYLVSSRYMHTVTYISGETGEIIWILGGKKNMFADLSGGKATDFAYQHDARWSSDYTTVSIFDNGIDDTHGDNAPYTRGLRIELDQENMTAELIGEYINPHKIKSRSQGSLQVLDNTVFMGYGDSAAFTEYASNGTVLCDAHFGPESQFGAHHVQSYRAFKFEWHGWPITDPDTRFLRNKEDEWTFYASWNGATEVDAWILQGALKPEPTEEEWEDLEIVKKKEFETEFKILDVYPRYMRVVGIDNQFAVLGLSSPLDTGEEKIWGLPVSRLDENETWALKFLIGFAALLGVVVGSREIWGFWRLRRKRVHWEQLEGRDIMLE